MDRRDARIESVLTRARNSLRDLLTGCVELEQPFCVDAERAEWRHWAEARLGSAELLVMEMRYAFDDDDGQAHHGPYGAEFGAYVREIEALSTRLRTAIGNGDGS